MVVVTGVWSFFLEVHGVIPDWASIAIISTSIGLAVVGVERRRKRGAEERFVRMLLGVPTITLVAVSVGHLLRWFPFH